jgi:large subunit ribosomal protein L15
MELNTVQAGEGARTNKKRVGRGVGSGLGQDLWTWSQGPEVACRWLPQSWLRGRSDAFAAPLPKRGFKSLTGARNVEVRLSEIERLPVDEIDLATLRQANLVPQQVLSAKVVLSGEITRKVSLKGVGATAGARAAIEAAGGSVSE